MPFQNISSKAFEFFIGLALVGLTVYPSSVPGWLGIALIFGLIENKYIGIIAWSSLSSLTKISLILPILYFLIYLIGLMHTEDMNSGWNDVVRRITLVAAPGFLIVKGISADRLSKWTTYFLIGILLSLVWNNLQSYIVYAETGEVWHFFGEHAVSQMHLGYFALHLLVGIGFVVQRIFKYHLKNRNFAYGLGMFALYIIVNLIITGSKMGFLTLIAMLGVSLFIMLARGVGWRRISIAILVIGTVLLVLVERTSFLAERFERMTVDTPIDPESIESTQARRMAWICAKEIFIGNFALGLGTGDTQTAMMECYDDKGYVGPASKNLGPHSQYLESGMAVGILGALSLFLMLFIPLMKALKLQHIASTMFFLAFVMACISESIFERAMGIHLFSLLLPLILIWMEVRREEVETRTNVPEY